MRRMTNQGLEPVVLVEGCRTPFAKAFGPLAHLDSIDLGRRAVSELVLRSGIDPEIIDEVIFGSVVPCMRGPNLAREIVLGIGLPATIPGFTLNRACTSSLQSASIAVQMIATGQADCVIAGGAESASNTPVPVRKELLKFLMGFQRKGALGQLRQLLRFRPGHWVPAMPALAEPSTGLTMGQHAEIMAQEAEVDRSSQDELALRSHRRAARATAEGHLSDEIAPIWVGKRFETCLASDPLVRADTSMAALGRLRPVFDRKYGTITAGNASPLTDGAAACLFLSQSKAKELGLEAKAIIRSHVYRALDPALGLLYGPAVSTPPALERAGVSWSDIDLVEMHEAFAAQVLCNIRAFESDAFAQEKLGMKGSIGSVDWERFNVAGGSIAIGHPFAATGSRMLTTASNALRRQGGRYALVTACAAGAMGGTFVLENPN
ncbi:MAG: acetyl-CoA C-acyltransferase [Planctomycetota bacterium]|nr:acetyl-CoA C-acyltransferase [Planctomycetota bacterium]